MSTAIKPIAVTTTALPRARPAWMLAAVRFFVPYLIVAVRIQWASGSYGSEIGHDSDEPAHVMTSLMIRAYVLSGFHESAMRYAEQYYIHYPKVGLGMWPPVFNIATAAWTIVVPPGRTS